MQLELELRTQLDHANVWEGRGHALRRTVSGPVVANEHVVWERLSAEMQEAAFGEVPAVMHRHDDVVPGG